MEIAWVCISPADIAHNSSRSTVEWRDQTPKLTAYKADLYMPQVQGSINAAYSRWEPKLVTPHSFKLCHMDLLIQLFDGSRILASGSGFWCRQISFLLMRLLSLLELALPYSDFQTLLVCSLCCSNYIFIWSHLCPVLALFHFFHAGVAF